MHPDVERARAIQDGEGARALLLEWEKQGKVFDTETLSGEECLAWLRYWVEFCDFNAEVRSVVADLKGRVPAETWDDATEALVAAVAQETLKAGTRRSEILKVILDVVTLDLEGILDWMAKLPQDRQSSFRGAARGILDPTSVDVAPARYQGIRHRLAEVKEQVLAGLV